MPIRVWSIGCGFSSVGSVSVRFWIKTAVSVSISKPSQHSEISVSTVARCCRKSAFYAGVLLWKLLGLRCRAWNRFCVCHEYHDCLVMTSDNSFNHTTWCKYSVQYIYSAGQLMYNGRETCGLCYIVVRQLVKMPASMTTCAAGNCWYGSSTQPPGPRHRAALTPWIVVVVGGTDRQQMWHRHGPRAARRYTRLQASPTRAIAWLSGRRLPRPRLSDHACLSWTYNILECLQHWLSVWFRSAFQ